jgi:undecaprenyl-diphosphatase
VDLAKNRYRSGSMPHHGKDATDHGSLPIAPVRARRHRAFLFQAYVLIASGVFVVLAVLAHFRPYFAIDLTITRALQSHHNRLLGEVMLALTWLGFLPQVAILGAAVIAGLYLAGLRREAAATAFAALGMVLAMAIKLVVHRPRPSSNLVHVLNQLSSASFPSGHVMAATTFCGFLLFLTYTSLKPSLVRTALLSLFGLLIALMGPSRIYLGQHWFSDVMGAYVLGSLWLAITIKLYRRGMRSASRSS